MINTEPESSRHKEYFSTDNLKAGLRTRALRGATLTIAGQSSSFIIQTTGTIVLARLLSPQDFGLVTMVLAFSLLLQSVGCNGFIEAVVQRKEINHEQMSTLFWINAGLGLLLMVLFLASAPVLAWFYKDPRLKSIAAVMAISILLGGLSNQHVSLLIRNMQFFKTTSNDVMAAFVSVLTAIVLARAGWGYWALVAKWIISPLMITAGAWFMCGWRPGLPARGTGVRPMLGYAFHTYGNFIMSYFRRNIDKMLIGRSFGSHQLGSYDRAYQLSNMLPVQLLGPLNSVSHATFSRLSDDTEKYRHNYLKVLSMLAFVAMPLSAALTVSSHDVILLLLGPQWSKAGQIFFAFGPSIGVAVIYMTHGWLHLSLGTPDRWFRWSIVEFAVTVLCFIIGLKFGALGVAVAFSTSFYILIGPALWYAGRPIRLKLFSVLSSLWNYYASAFAAGLLCWFILHSFASTSHVFLKFNTITRILVSVILCIAVYLSLIVTSFRGTKPISQFISLLREMIQRRVSSK